MKVLVFFSGGKDSQACLIHSVQKYGAKNCEAVFCDTGWEHPLTYEHINYVTETLGVKLVTLKSKKYDGLVDLSVKKQRFPSTKARFCTEELKSKPAIDYVLIQNDNLIIIEGIRAGESFNRSKMEPQCTYFKFYFQPMLNGKTHTYRKKEIVKWCERYNADKIRPVFDWTGQQVIDYIKENGQNPNPLYSMGFNRVGCFPCIMCRHFDMLTIIKNFPDQLERLIEAENKVGRTFFPPDYIPKWATKSKKVVTVEDVIKYLTDKNATGDLFKQDDDGITCMSYYGLCE